MGLFRSFIYNRKRRGPRTEPLIGTILAIWHIFRNNPVVNDLFIRVDKGMEIVSWNSLKIFVVMLFSPKLLLFFEVFIRSDISLGVVGGI